MQCDGVLNDELNIIWRHVLSGLSSGGSTLWDSCVSIRWSSMTCRVLMCGWWCVGGGVWVLRTYGV